MKNTNFLISVILLMIATASQAAEVAGNVGYMSGSLIAQRADGTIKVMGPKSEVLAGDTLVTAKDSYVQVQMKDGAKMTLRPHSTLKIEEYRFNKQEPKSDNAIFRLLKGGFRTVTGLIGKRGDPDAYKVRAATATIGIRGTDFSTRLCATPNCQDDVAAPAKLSVKSQVIPAQAALQAVQSMSLWKILSLPLKVMMTSATADNPPPVASPAGLYVTVHKGQVIMAQADRVLNLGGGETGFASAAALIRLPAPPAFMDADTKQTDAIETKASKAEESKSGGKSEEGKGDDKSDKEKVDTKPDEEKDSGSQDKEKTDSKSDEEKDNGKPGEEKTGSKPGGEKDTINSSEENANSSDPSINKSGCAVQW